MQKTTNWSDDPMTENELERPYAYTTDEFDGANLPYYPPNLAVVDPTDRVAVVAHSQAVEQLIGVLAYYGSVIPQEVDHDTVVRTSCTRWGRKIQRTHFCFEGSVGSPVSFMTYLVIYSQNGDKVDRRQLILVVDGRAIDIMDDSVHQIWFNSSYSALIVAATRLSESLLLTLTLSS